jgi:hypothetical protein
MEMDAHKATTVIVVLNIVGKVIAQAAIETTSSLISDFLKSQRGTLHRSLWHFGKKENTTIKRKQRCCARHEAS